MTTNNVKLMESALVAGPRNLRSSELSLIEQCKLRDRFGICQWFHFEDYRSLCRSADLLRSLGVKHLRTGVSWADYHRPGGKDWYDAMFGQLDEFEILLSIWHTPPSLARDGRCACPPKRLLDYADFIDQIISSHGSQFSHLELWNEPNNCYKWDFKKHDPKWKKFAEMVGAAAYWARSRGVTTVLGGMMPVDPHWLELMENYGVLEHIDIVGIHGFPGMWWPDRPNWDWHSHWSGWDDKVASLGHVVGARPVWITETGLATWSMEEDVTGLHDLQVYRLQEAARATVPRTYWYNLIDLDPRREAIEGFHVDENEYNLGLVTYEGQLKPAFHRLARLLEEA
jgi:CDP-paratose 2-epimerase